MKKTIALYLRPRSRVVWCWLVSAALMAAASFGAAWVAAERYAAVSATSQRIARLRAAELRKPGPALSKKELDQKKRWADLSAERDFAWAPLFDALESAANGDIELLEFHPDKSNRLIVLRGEARDERALVEFIDALSQNPILKNVHLSHRKLRKRDRLETVAFELKAGVSPASRLPPVRGR